jgi:hypothetical protein
MKTATVSVKTTKAVVQLICLLLVVVAFLQLMSSAPEAIGVLTSVVEKEAMLI